LFGYSNLDGEREMRNGKNVVCAFMVSEKVFSVKQNGCAFIVSQRMSLKIIVNI